MRHEFFKFSKTLKSKFDNIKRGFIELTYRDWKAIHSIYNQKYRRRTAGFDISFNNLSYDMLFYQDKKDIIVNLGNNRGIPEALIHIDFDDIEFDSGELFKEFFNNCSRKNVLTRYCIMILRMIKHYGKNPIGEELKYGFSNEINREQFEILRTIDTNYLIENEKVTSAAEKLKFQSQVDINIFRAEKRAEEDKKEAGQIRRYVAQWDNKIVLKEWDRYSQQEIFISEPIAGSQNEALKNDITTQINELLDRTWRKGCSFYIPTTPFDLTGSQIRTDSGDLLFMKDYIIKYKDKIEIPAKVPAYILAAIKKTITDEEDVRGVVEGTVTKYTNPQVDITAYQVGGQGKLRRLRRKHTRRKQSKKRTKRKHKQTRRKQTRRKQTRRKQTRRKQTRRKQTRLRIKKTRRKQSKKRTKSKVNINK